MEHKKAALAALKRLLHILPFVHFYGRWEDINDPNATAWHWYQKQYCEVCNRGRRRWTDSSAVL